MKKITYEFVKWEFAKVGFELLSTEYITNALLDFKCPNGHFHKTTWVNFKQGSRCPYCTGNAKLNIDYVREEFNKAGYTLLSEKYLNSKTPLDYRCSQGHLGKTIFSTFKKGSRCARCSVKNKTLGIDFVRQEFEKVGYTLLSTEYTNIDTPLEFRCNNGHTHRLRYHSFQQGQRCGHCSKRVKLTIDFVKQEFEKAGYTLLSTEYFGNNVPLSFRCNNGHLHKIIWASFQSGQRCGYCTRNVGVNIDFVKKEFEKEGYKLLSTEYLNNSTLLDYECNQSHIHKISWTHFQQGKRCAYCARKAKPKIDDIRKEFEKYGYTLLSTQYVNSYTPLDYKCDRNHLHKIGWSSFSRGIRCAHCAGMAKHNIDFIRKEFESIGYKLLSTEYLNSFSKLDFECDKFHRHKMSWSNFRQGVRCGICFSLKENGKYFCPTESLKGRTKKKSFLSEQELDEIFNKILPQITPIYSNCKDGFNVDHIIPFSFFNHSIEKEIRACWSVENLRYLTRAENFYRNNYLSYNEYISLTPKQLDILQIASQKPKQVQICLNHPDLDKRVAYIDLWKLGDENGKKFFSTRWEKSDYV